MCAATLNGGPLVCVRGDHTDNGHTYVATWASDRHTDEVNDE